MESVNYTIELTYKIKGVKGYSFAKDKHLYNIKTSRKLKQALNGGSIGYWIGKKFYTLKKIKPLLYKPKQEKLPF